MKKSDIRKELTNDIIKLSEIEEKALKDLEKVPEGKIYATSKGKNGQFYWIKNKGDSPQYIKRDNNKLINQLIQKEYAEKVLHTVKKQKKIIKKFVDKYDENAVLNVCNKITEPKVRRINTYVKNNEEYVSEWLKKQEEILKSVSKHALNNGYDDDVEFLTENGENVKSKSEKIIADKLYIMKVPYCYEVPLYFKGYGYVKPDFKVLNMETRQEFYWEHFGMMNDDNYVRKTMKKIRQYGKNGFIQGKNLILTFESSECPLDIKNVEKIIEALLVK